MVLCWSKTKMYIAGFSCWQLFGARFRKSSTLISIAVKLQISIIPLGTCLYLSVPLFREAKKLECSSPIIYGMKIMQVLHNISLETLIIILQHLNFNHLIAKKPLDDQTLGRGSIRSALKSNKIASGWRERETAWVTCPPKCWTKSCCQVADKGKRGLGAVYVKPTSREPAPYHSKEVSRTVREVAAAVHWWCICCSHDHITTDEGIYSSMMCSLLSVHMAVLPA